MTNAIYYVWECSGLLVHESRNDGPVRLSDGWLVADSDCRVEVYRADGALREVMHLRAGERRRLPRGVWLLMVAGRTTLAVSPR